MDPEPKTTQSAVKLPPVAGYKLDQLGLSEASEKILKSSMQSEKAVYKNPRARKIL